jgi:hypothetical protein
MSEPEIEFHDAVVLDNPEQKVTYANLGRVIVSPEEVTLHFGIRKQDDLNVADGVAKIFITLSHAKRLVIAWTKILQQHEELFGEIVIDPLKKLTPKGKEFLEKAKENNDTTSRTGEVDDKQ